jgi:hypothetical protein
LLLLTLAYLLAAGTAGPAAGAAVLELAPKASGSSLRSAVQAIPGYASHRPARWVISSRYDPNWGTADWYRDTIYISPRTPRSMLGAVVRHEWSHELSVRAYGGDVAAAVRAMDRVFAGGRGGLHGAEVAADCMARLLGAHWTHYTSCANAAWRRQAARLLHGQRLR